MNAQIGYLVGLAMEYIQKSDLDGAERLLKQALKMAPKNSEIFRLLGVNFAFKKDLEGALVMFDRSIRAEPKNWLAHSNRGNILKDFKRFDEALVCYDKAIQLQPNYAEAYSNLGNALEKLNLSEMALAAYKKGIEFGSERSINLVSYIFCKMRLCDWGGIEEQYQKVINEELNQLVKIQPFPLLAFLDNPVLIKKFTKEYISAEYPYKSDLGSFKATSHSKKIRLGYFSPDFRNHAVSFLIAGVIESHNRDDFELIGFSTSPASSDGMRERLELSFDKFVDVSRFTDLGVAQLSREMGIDIAIDLGGFTGESRLGIFSFRAAPIQIEYIGYLGTTAAAFMDYIIADKIIIPDEFRNAYSEKIIYLPSFQANDSKREISSRKFTRDDLGLSKGTFVYCCLNNSYKITPGIFDSWARILKAVEGSLLFIYADGDAIKKNLRSEIENRGISSARLIFGGYLPRDEYLARYRVADLFLDTSPYNAGTTASDALWAGLPVLTFAGQSFPSRMGASLLNAIGLPELIASSQQDYESIAIDLGRNPYKLDKIKAKLAANRLTTLLFDTKQFTANLEAAYIKVYERCRLGLPPDHID